MHCSSAAAGSCAEHSDMQKINNKHKLAFLQLNWATHQVCNFIAIAFLQKCKKKNVSISVVTLTVCGILLSLFSHAERVVFPILESLWDHYLLCYLCMQVCILHGWWFAHYLCVWAVSCVCWRGVWEGHHCGRIIMEIPNQDLPALCVRQCCFSVPYCYFLHQCFYSLLSPCKHLNVFFPPVSFLNMSLAHYFGYIWRSSWLSPSHLVCFF